MPARKLLTRTERLARERAIIQDLRAGLLSYRKIAAKHRVSLPTVNAKARKAGIRRSRRGPAALMAATKVRAVKTARRRKVARRVAVRKVGRRVVARKVARRVAVRKVARRVAVRRATLRAKARVTARRRVRKVRRAVIRAAVIRRMARGPMARGPRGARAFREQFRELVIRHYPNISLKTFARLTNPIDGALR
jgi:hypothetical protein